MPSNQPSHHQRSQPSAEPSTAASTAAGGPIRILHSENLSALRSLPDCSVELIYIDPPF